MRLWIALVCAGLLGACGGRGEGARDSASTVLVFAAVSTSEAMERVGARFEAETGIAVTASFASSATLAQQIRAGATAGVFLSAHVQWVDVLAEEGLVAERAEAFGNSLVLVVPADSEAGVEDASDLVNEAVRRIAIGDTNAVPAGIYAKEALQQLGLWEAVESKTIPAGNVRMALLYVERGEADAGIVYATDAAVSDRVRIVARLDSSLARPVRYSLALMSGSTEDSAARQFYDYLQSAAAAEIFSQLGFEVISPAS